MAATATIKNQTVSQHKRGQVVVWCEWQSSANVPTVHPTETDAVCSRPKEESSLVHTSILQRRSSNKTIFSSQTTRLVCVHQRLILTSGQCQSKDVIAVMVMLCLFVSARGDAPSSSEAICVRCEHRAKHILVSGTNISIEENGIERIYFD